MRKRIVIEIGLDNACFEGSCVKKETAEIVKRVAERIETGSTARNFFDTNGNTYGSFAVETVRKTKRNMYYVLVGRCGTEIVGTFGSTNLNEVKQVMRESYKSVRADEKDDLQEGSKCGSMAAIVITSGDSHEWEIYTFDMGESTEDRMSA